MDPNAFENVIIKLTEELRSGPSENQTTLF